jgi:hypothetical protein
LSKIATIARDVEAFLLRIIAFRRRLVEKGFAVPLGFTCE